MLSIRLQNFLGKTVLLRLLLLLLSVVVVVVVVAIFLVLIAVLLSSASTKLFNICEQFQFLPSAFAKKGCENAPISSVISACPSVLLSSCNSSRTTEDISVNFGIGHITEICQQIPIVAANGRQ